MNIRIPLACDVCAQPVGVAVIDAPELVAPALNLIYAKPRARFICPPCNGVIEHAGD